MPFGHGTSQLHLWINKRVNKVMYMYVCGFWFCNAPISVKPEGGGRGGRATHGNLTVADIPRVGILIGHHAFDLSILCSRREVNHLFLLILTILFCPGVGILIIFLENVKIPTLCPTPPPPRA